MKFLHLQLEYYPMQFAISIFSRGFNYQSWMSVVSNLKSIKIREVGAEGAKSTFSYGLYCSCCTKFITNYEGFSDYIVKLLGLLQIAVNLQFGHTE